MLWSSQDLADAVGADLRGPADVQLTGCATLEEAGPGDLAFVANRKYASQLKTSRAGAVVVGPEVADQAPDRCLLVAKDPYFTFRQAMVRMLGFRDQPAAGVSPQAVVDPSASLGEGVSIGPFCVVGPGAFVGDRTVLHPGAQVGPQARIGADCLLYPHVVIYDDCVLGDRVTLHAGCVIGQDGFGYATHAPHAAAERASANEAAGTGPPIHHKIPPAGNAVVEDDVEMGAACTVDRATMGSTVIGRGTKFSNSVTIGHGCKVGRYNLLVAQVGLAGSVTTGDYVVMGGQVGVAGHLKIADRVQIAAQSGVMHDLAEPGMQYGGQPARELSLAKRQVLAAMKLPDLASELKKLKRQLAKLETKPTR